MCFGLGCKCGRIPEEPTPVTAAAAGTDKLAAIPPAAAAVTILEPAIPGLRSTMVRRAHSDHNWSPLEAQVSRSNPAQAKWGTRSLMHGTAAAAAAAAAAAGAANSRSSSVQQSDSRAAVPWNDQSSMCRPATDAAASSSATGTRADTRVSAATARAAVAAPAAAAMSTATAAAASAVCGSSGRVPVNTVRAVQRNSSSTHTCSPDSSPISVTRTYSVCIDHVDYELQQLTYWWSIVDQVVDQLQLEGMRLQEQLEKWGRHKLLLEGLVQGPGILQGLAGDKSDYSRMRNNRWVSTIALGKHWKYPYLTHEGRQTHTRGFALSFPCFSFLRFLPF